MITGDSITVFVGRQTAAGAASTGKVLADFAVAINGVSVTPTSFAELATVGLWRWYSFLVVAPSAVGTFSLAVDVASGTDSIWIPQGEIELNDADTIAALVGSAVGAPSVGTGTQTDGDLGAVVQGDAWGTGTLTASASALAAIGLTDLTGGTISAALKQQPADSPTNITATIISGAGRTFSASWNTFPAGMALGAGITESTWFLDVQFKHTATSKILTIYRAQLRVVWQRDTTT
jgi:hypothetical protein